MEREKDWRDTFWFWLVRQVVWHFGDAVLVVMIFSLLLFAFWHALILRDRALTPAPENMGWLREQIAALIGCLLGRLAHLNTKLISHENGDIRVDHEAQEVNENSKH